MEEQTNTEQKYFFFTNDAQGNYIDSNGNRYTAHSGMAFHTPQGLNVGCPAAFTEEEAATIKGYTYDPLPFPEETVENNIEEG